MSRNRARPSGNLAAHRGSRIKSWRAFPALAVLAALSGCADAGGGRCTMREVSTFAVLTTRGQPVVRAALDGEPVAFVVDTGAFTSTVTTAVADKVGLPIDYDRRLALGGVGGTVFVYSARIDRLSFGTAEARNAEFWRADQPRGTVAGLPIGGLFGADFLANYDVFLDLPNRQIKLYRAQGCGGDIVPPLPEPLVALRFGLDQGSHVVIPVRVDDHPIEAVLDSGAVRTVLNLDDAHAVGVTDAMLAGDRQVASMGVDGRRVGTSLHEFRSLAIGGETRHPARLAVSDIETQTLIGDDFFRRNQVWISYPHHMVFFHPVGSVQVLPPDAPVQQTPRPAVANAGASR